MLEVVAMKYIRILLLIALLTISFTSCSEPDNPNGDIEPEQNHVNYRKYYYIF